MSKIYDVIILGAGPAGLAAGLYAGRSRLSTLIIEKGKDVGQIAITDEIENYPGQIVEGESGPSLIARMTQAKLRSLARAVTGCVINSCWYGWRCEEARKAPGRIPWKNSDHCNRCFCMSDWMQKRKRIYGKRYFLLCNM